MSREQAEKEVVGQLVSQWEAIARSGYIPNKYYPAVISYNTRNLKVRLFKKKGSKYLYLERLGEKSIYGPMFIRERVSNGKLESVDSILLCGLTKEAQQEKINEFNNLFECDSLQTA